MKVIIPEPDELNDRSPMPFGKYKGKPMEEVPDGYLLWLLEQEWLEEKYPSVNQYIKDVQKYLDNDNSRPSWGEDEDSIQWDNEAHGET